MKKLLKKEESVFGKIVEKIKNRNFTSAEELEIRNSYFTLLTSAVSKFGSLVFIVIISRLLLPELFGIYSIVLAVIMIFALFADLGMGQSMVRFVSRELGRNKKSKARAYVNYFVKRKLLLAFSGAVLLIIFSIFFSESVFDKPVFFGLLAGSFYLVLIGLSEIVEYLLISTNSFRNILWKETVFQVSRIVFVPLLVIAGIKYSFTDGTKVFLVITGLALAVLVSALAMIYFSKKKFDFLKSRKVGLEPKEKKSVRKFLFTMPSIAISSMFFGEIDILILGFFVLSEFVGYYRAVLGITWGLAGLVSFSIALLPVFSALGKKELKKDFAIFAKMTFGISVFIAALTFVFAPEIIQIIYGAQYAISSNLLQLFCLAVLSTPLISLYETYFISIGKPEKFSGVLIYSTIFNVVLTIFLIVFFLQYGQMQAVYGAVAASLISRYLVLGALMIGKRGN